jgi:hypothetical protein
MAKAKDLAGLAALGFLGYKMSQMGKDKDNAGDQKTSSYTGADTRTKGVEEEPRRKIEGYQKKAPLDDTDKYPSGVMGGARSSSGTRGGSNISMKEKETPSGDTSVTETVKTPASTVSSSEKGMKNYVPRRKTTVSSSAEGMKNYVPRRALSPVDQIPGQDRSGPTGGERVSGSDLSRNVSNTMNALTPLGGGAGKVGAELATAGRAQKAYNAAQTERRAAEGMSPAEALAARQAAREAKTLNPNAWLAGPKGMAENFRKGGMTASRRGDGIATKGKTRGRIC